MKHLIALFLLSASTLLAIDRVTMTVTVTNQPVTGDEFTLNSDTRYWTNSLTPTTILTNSASVTNNFIQSSTTNLWNAINTHKFSGNLFPTWISATQFSLLGQWEGVMVGAQVGDWCEFSYSTQTVSESYPVRVPLGNMISQSQATNIASLMVYDIDIKSTNRLSTNATALANFARKTNEIMYGARISSLISTSGVNYGNAFRSPGSGAASEQFGSSASATAANATAVGASAVAAGASGTALGTSATASGGGSVALGNGATVYYLPDNRSGDNATAIGTSARASGTNAISIGMSSTADHNNSISIGQSSSTTASNQFMLGASLHNVVVPGVLNPSAITNSLLKGTNQVNGSLGFSRSTVESVADGNNTIAIPDNCVYVSLTAGPTATWTNCAMSGTLWDGRYIILENATGEDMTISHQSGFDGTAARRIITHTAADVVTTGRRVTTWIYNGADSRWILISP